MERIDNVEDAYEASILIANSIDNAVLKNTALEILKTNKENFLNIRGSDWQHHNYNGGLIIHTCNVALLSIEIAKFYSDKISTDLIKFSALMHDVGKLFDYDKDVTIINTEELKMNQLLLGHSYEGSSYVERILIKNFDDSSVNYDKETKEKLISQCIHCIGAHMIGYGAIAKQQMLEVFIIGHADWLDAEIMQSKKYENDVYFKTESGNLYFKSLFD